MPSVTKRIRVAFRRHVLEADLVTHFAAELNAEFLRDARGEQSRGEAARLENDDLAIARRARLSKASAGPEWFCRTLSGPAGRDALPSLSLVMSSVSIS